MLRFNDPEESKIRHKTPPLSLKAENRCIEIINRCLYSKESIQAGSDEEILLRQFIHNYENMCYHHSITFGLWVIENPDDVLIGKDKIFQIK